MTSAKHKKTILFSTIIISLIAVVLVCYYFYEKDNMLSAIIPSKVKFPDRNVNELEERHSIYQFTVKDISANDFKFYQFKGKKLMIVNTASKCGLTPQYKKLQEMYEKYQSQGFEVVGFPANNFMKQEPGSEKEIEAFCEKNYGVTFPMMSKISVKGKDKHPIYQFLTQKSKNGVLTTSVKWNFQKFLIDEEGFLVTSVAPAVQPNHKKIIDWIISK